jgi:DNA-binding SARP family transcriptional activator
MRSPSAADATAAIHPHLHDQTEPVVHLIGGPYVCYGGASRAVPEGSKKLLAFVALRRNRLERSYVAGTLWPFGDDLRAAGNLRSSLWRLRQAGIDVIHTDKWSLVLAEGVRVDVDLLGTWASRVIHGAAEPADLTTTHLPDGACDLLPGWDDEWVVIHRERVRQRVLHALESLAALLSARGQHAEAIDAAIQAVCEEPLRESAHRALLSAHLAQGNYIEAQLAYGAFARRLRRELAVEPSPQIRELLGEQWISNSDAVVD